MKHDICVIGGLGHVGLPLSIVFACRGLDVLVYDRNEAGFAPVMAGTMPFIEEGGEAFLGEALSKGKLHFTCRTEEIGEARTLVVVIGTPVDAYLNPKLELIMSLLEEITPFLRDGQMMILRSTLFPGTTQIVKEYFEKRNLKIRVTFCPERIAEGKAFNELFHLPQIISGFCEEDLQEVEALFGRLGCETLRLEPIEAELGKLFTNAWRYFQFAISNQFYMVAGNYNLDFYKIFNAITYNYPRISQMARAGFAAGPCLFKDTLQLAAFNNNQFDLGYAAMTTNEGLPAYVIDKLKAKIPLKGRTVGILGMAFKGGSDDKRGSLSYKLRRILRWEAGEVLCTDPYIQESDFLPAQEVVRRSDVLILGSPHPEYKTLDMAGKHVVDVWNFFGKGGVIA
jgi:UDP-N-acetyl-D-mannosaminuronic acid dehydrogenase